MHVIGPEDAPVRQAPSGPGLRARVLASPDSGLDATVGMVEISIAPGGSLPPHAHGDAETVLYVLDGLARFVCEGREADVAGAGAVLVHAGSRVAVTNVGADTLRFLAVFSPAGFERGFLPWSSTSDEDAGGDPPHALLDLRGLPRPQRHRTVIATLEQLERGTRLIIVSDHEPAALRRQLERRYDARLGWDLRERSEDRVAVAIWLAAEPEPVLDAETGDVVGRHDPPAA